MVRALFTVTGKETVINLTVTMTGGAAATVAVMLTVSVTATVTATVTASKTGKRKETVIKFRGDGDK